MNLFALLGRQTAGTWVCYRDRNRMFLGRSVEGPSVIWACLGLVAEYVRPAGFSAQAMDAARRKTVRRWTKIRNELWARALYILDHRPAETADEFDTRRMSYVRRFYDARAADERALHPQRWTPALAELSIAAMSADDGPAVFTD